MTREHLDNGLLVRFLDGELSDSEFVTVRSHLASCADCRLRRDEFVALSGQVESLLRGTPVGDGQAGRSELAKFIQIGRGSGASRRPASVTLPQFGWGIGFVAAVLVGVLFVPHLRRGSGPAVSSESPARTTSIYVNGESFLALPYSNPDLPMTAPRIIEMQVPVSALAAQGIVFDPVGSDSSDRTVLANVLLGLDGQPLGVHVLSAE